MTAEEAVQAICAAMEEGDLVAATDHFAPDIVFYGTVGGIDEAEVLQGRDTFVRYYRDVAGTWDEWRVQTDEVRGDGGTFVVFWRETTRSRGIQMENETATVFKFRDGKVVEGRGYLDRAAALEAAGLA